MISQTHSVLLSLLALVALSCGGARAPSPSIRFGRQGLLSPGSVQAITDPGGAPVAFTEIALPGGSVLALCAWRPAQSYRVTLASGVELSATAPARPEPLPLARLDLGALFPLDPQVHRGHTPTTLCFAPGGDRLYLGTSEGFQVLSEPLSGEITRLPRLPEAYIRQAAFAPDGARLYVGEQSREGRVHAYALTRGGGVQQVWETPLFPDVIALEERDADPIYAWAHQPGPYRLLPLGERLLVVANHSWPRGDRYQNRARVHLLDAASGRILWSWPRSGDLPEKITWVDAAQSTVALVAHFAEASKSAVPLPPEYPPGTLHVLDLETGDERSHVTFEPLRPYFAQAECWRGLALRGDGKAVAGALDDGRVFAWSLDTSLLWRPLTTPLDVGGAPLLATAGSVAGLGDRFLVATGDTYTPWILRAEDVRPPQPHPNGRTLFCFDFALQLQWLLRLENDVEGLAVASDRSIAAVSLARVVNPAPGDVNGVSVFDLAATGSGVDRYRYTYSFGGTCPYDTLALSPDGRFIAVVEMPYTPREGGTPVGEATLHVIH